jgi:hypothetical protein
MLSSGKPAMEAALQKKRKSLSAELIMQILTSYIDM